jgi:hypothetical protein
MRCGRLPSRSDVNMRSSVWLMTFPNIGKYKTCSKPPTRLSHHLPCQNPINPEKFPQLLFAPAALAQFQSHSVQAIRTAPRFASRRGRETRMLWKNIEKMVSLPGHIRYTVTKVEPMKFEVWTQEKGSDTWLNMMKTWTNMRHCLKTRKFKP